MKHGHAAMACSMDMDMDMQHLRSYAALTLACRIAMDKKHLQIICKDNLK
jgi:hypothetical protein